MMMLRISSRTRGSVHEQVASEVFMFDDFLDNSDFHAARQNLAEPSMITHIAASSISSNLREHGVTHKDHGHHPQESVLAPHRGVSWPRMAHTLWQRGIGNVAGLSVLFAMLPDWLECSTHFTKTLCALIVGGFLATNSSHSLAKKTGSLCGTKCVFRHVQRMA